MPTYRAALRIQLRKQILDVQGKAVEHALHALNFTGMHNVRIGKYVELLITADSKVAAEEALRKACSQLMANPIMEDFWIDCCEEVS
ncbi:MAG: phosphoribosylformylglycinamidine synthase subunit PurS [Bacteroidota bacterium]|nr:phosphoribosylformylglycinamidine synthase subunit PurS [Candidatus Kapabacteria bacterium]MDW8219746.1 phosphoribosylformylglycinamidine synthase subunit PurS [Bacteroidota bacterium]